MEDIRLRLDMPKLIFLTAFLLSSALYSRMAKQSSSVIAIVIRFTSSEKVGAKWI